MSSVEAVNGMYATAPVHATNIVSAKPRPRVTTTLWEDENTLCFQVEARGISVARREDNDMINGTKLLNVAGMTRGRRDGMLKAEKVRHVVKIGAMHLKGVWIPFDRAAAFAQKEGIAEMLYPLFVEDIRSFLYRQQNPGPAGDVAMLQGGQENKGYPAAQHPQMIPGAGQMPMQSMGHQPMLAGAMPEQKMGRADDANGPPGAGPQSEPSQGAGAGADQMGGQHQAYGRQYGTYMPHQYGMQGYGPMGSYNSATYGSPYGSYPQMVYGNQDYAQQAQQPPQQVQPPQAQQPQAQQAIYYQSQGYQQGGYDQAQLFQQAQASAQVHAQHAQHAPTQHQASQQHQAPQAHQQQYYQQHQAPKAIGKEDGEPK